MAFLASISMIAPENKLCPIQLPPKNYGQTLKGFNDFLLGMKRQSDATSVHVKAGGPKPEVEVEEEKKEETGDSVSPVPLTLDDVNPVGLGRKSRQVFDEVWRKFSELGQLSRTPRYEEESVLVGGPMCDFATPGAQDTTVLVVGATSRIGRIVVRKLMIRGYKVKALVRNAEFEILESLPRSIDIVVGDVGEPSTVQAAVQGCNKVIYCATARTDITVDLNRVDHLGVYNVSKAFQDYNHMLAQIRAGRSSKSKMTIMKFTRPEALEGWEVEDGTYFTDIVSSRYDGGMDGEFEFKEGGGAVFSGYVFTRGGYIDLTRKISLPLGSTLDRYEGLLFSLGGDGKSYIIILETAPSEDESESKQYFKRITTRIGFGRYRLPFSSFRPVKSEYPPLDPFLVHTMKIRFEPRKQKSLSISPQAAKDASRFKLTLEYIKALPTGQETDFILVSCTGAGIEHNKKEKVLKAKQAGENALKISGLGYTIVRPGPLLEEPGGQRALVFDQGNRITKGISCADVADICVKSLHDSTARNKSFDVCYEYTRDQGQYELVAHLPDKSNNYLTPALSVLEKNT